MACTATEAQEALGPAPVIQPAPGLMRSSVVVEPGEEGEYPPSCPLFLYYRPSEANQIMNAECATVWCFFKYPWKNYVASIEQRFICHVSPQLTCSFLRNMWVILSPSPSDKMLRDQARSQDFSWWRGRGMRLGVRR